MKGKIIIKIISLLLVLICLLGCFTACNASTNSSANNQEHTIGEQISGKKLTESEIIAKLKPSVLKVICYDYDGETEMSQGSGFFIDNQGTFITNAHVVEDCFFIKVKTHLGATYEVDVMYKYNGTVSDYAICKARNCFSSQAVEFSSTAKAGDAVYALGYPNGATTMSTTKGKITNINAEDGTKNYYANTAWIDHGSSGGILADAQGKVLGITTGVFDDGEYAALKYQDFKHDVDSPHIGVKAPVEYFHTVDKVMLGSYNMDEYFDVFVDGNALSDTSVTYWITVRLKEKYRNKKIVIDSTSISIDLKLNTEFQYKEVLSYGTANRTKTDTKYVHIWFWDENNMITGDREYVSSSIFLSYSTNYYGMNISYDVDFFGGMGTLIIYDK